jgi:hypothetical protein
MPIYESKLVNLILGFKMQEWYDSINKKQKVLVWSASTVLILVYAVGFIPLAMLTYLEFGSNKK